MSVVQFVARWSGTAVGLVVISCAAVSAQSATATLRGTVEDPQERPVAGAAVTLVNVATNQRREVVSTAEGYVTVDQLPPATYEVTASAPGFASSPAIRVTLNVGDDRIIRLPLAMMSLTAEVQVRAGASRVQTSPAAGTVIGRELVANMPLSGRSLQSLFDLTPGVVRTSPGTGGQFVVNGQRPDANYFMVDGVSANLNVSPYAAGSGIAGTQPSLSVLNTTGTMVSVDALQEFRILTSTYAPEFGRTPGGQVSLVTRSGSNRFTGTLFEYFRHERMDATDWFAKRDGLPKPPTRQHDFGGVLGGPVRLPGYDGHDRTFFFFSYEGLRLNQPQVANTVVPSPAAREQATGVMRDILAVWPLPTGPEVLDTNGRPTGAAVYQASYGDPSEHDTTSLRIDQSLGRQGALFGRLSLSPSNASVRPLGMASVSLTERRTDALTLGHNWLRGRIGNDLRVNITRATGRNRSILDTFGGAEPVERGIVLPAFTTPETAALTFQMDYGALFPSFSLGTAADNRTTQLNIVDSVLVVAGTHAVKFGVDYRHLTVDLVSNASISPNFPSLDAFYTGVVPSLSVTARSRDLAPVVRELSLYGQDTWRPRERLTLTYGLRWELNPPPSADTEHAVMTVIGAGSPGSIDVAPPGTPLFPTRYDNLAPRLGAAYLLRRTPGSETTLRGGAGLYYDLGTTVALLGYEGYPHRTTVYYPDVPFPLDTAAAVTAPVFSSDPPYTTAYGYAADFVSPRTWQWNATIEQALGTRQSVSVAYVGAAGRKLTRTEAYRRPNPLFSDSVRVTRNSGSSDYKALQVQYTQRLRDGVQGMLSYTWSHSTDTGSTSATGNNLAIAFADAEESRADSDYDIRHNFAASISYLVPTPPGPRFLRALLGGFSIDALVKARSAPPVSLLGRGLTDPFNGVLRPDIVPGQPLYIDDAAAPGGRRLNPAAFALAPVNVQGSLPRNALRGFAASQVDLAVRRDIDLGGGARLQLRAEAFNVFNTPNFGNPVASLTSPQFGVATTMLNRSLGGLNALYEMGGPRSGQLAVKFLF